MATQKQLDDLTAEATSAKEEAMAAREELENARAELEQLHASRNSRETESRAADVIHEEYDDEWEEPTLLDTKNISARPGHVQRWVRTELNGKPDVANVSRKLNQGWKPRQADSVSKGQYVPTIEDGRHGNVIGMQGMILMERPAKMHESHGRRNRQATRDQMTAVDRSLFNAHDPSSKMGAPERTSSSRTTTGRNPRIADD